jgi:hypothetical protein
MTSDPGWPERVRLRSGSGPSGPIFVGVWQSPHPMLFTRYSPRATGSAAPRASSAETTAQDAAAPAAAITARLQRLKRLPFALIVRPPQWFSS